MVCIIPELNQFRQKQAAGTILFALAFFAGGDIISLRAWDHPQAHCRRKEGIITTESSLSVLVAASEAAPLAQSGGLAQMTGELPLALQELGCRVAVALPAYRRVLRAPQEWTLAAQDLPVRVGPLFLSADVLAGELAPDLPVYLVRRDEFFDRSELYGTARGEYFDNPERFIFFSRAIPALCPAVGFVPDVILANDWQTGLVMALLDHGALPETAGVFVIHNQAHLGLVPPERTENIGLPEKYFHPDGLEYFGQMSLLKAGIVYAQAVVTLSPTYAREIQTPDFGAGLDGLMRAVSNRLFGILNGVDYRLWDPAADPHLAARYSPEDLRGKAACKKDLLQALGLPLSLMDKPLLGLVNRLTAPKGVNLLAEAAQALGGLDVGLVLLGTGEPRYEELMVELQARRPDRFAVRLTFDPALAHKIVAGCDMFLGPSLSEPCGLGQMLGLKYGTLPVVRATGGLEDTVRDPSEGPNPGTGFKFRPFRARALVQAVRRAVEAFGDKEKWEAMMREAMAQDFSWHGSAQEYTAVFERAVRARRNRNA